MYRKQIKAGIFRTERGVHKNIKSRFKINLKNEDYRQNERKRENIVL